MSFDCGHTIDDIVGGVCAGCMADDDARLRELEAEVERLREGGKETNAKLDHTLQAYGRLERANADLRREVERLRSVAREAYEAGAAYFGLAVPLRGEEDIFNAAESRFAEAMQALYKAAALSLDAAVSSSEAEFGSPERPTP